jgi:hypothetical protein
MNVVVLDEAEAALTAAAEWYERERAGLGDDLLFEAAGALSSVADSPATWSFVSGSSVVRRYLFTRITHIVDCTTQNQHVSIIAFGPTCRRPGD